MVETPLVSFSFFDSRKGRLKTLLFFSSLSSFSPSSFLRWRRTFFLCRWLLTWLMLSLGARLSSSLPAPPWPFFRPRADRGGLSVDAVTTEVGFDAGREISYGWREGALDSDVLKDAFVDATDSGSVYSCGSRERALVEALVVALDTALEGAFDVTCETGSAYSCGRRECVPDEAEEEALDGALDDS